MLCCIRPRVNSSGDLKDEKKEGFVEKGEEKFVANVMNHTKCSSNSNGEKNKSEAIKTTQKPISKTFDNITKIDGTFELDLKTKETAEKEFKIKEKYAGEEVNANMGNKNSNVEVKPENVDSEINEKNVATTETIIIQTDIKNFSATEVSNITTHTESDTKTTFLSKDENTLPTATSSATTPKNQNTATSTVAQNTAITDHHIGTVPDQLTTPCEAVNIITSDTKAPTSDVNTDKVNRTNSLNQSSETGIKSTIANEDAEKGSISTDKEIEVYTKYVEKLENICLLIEEKFNNTASNVLIEFNEICSNKDNLTVNKDETDVTTITNETQPLYTIDDHVIHMTDISNNNEVKVKGQANKMLVQKCFRTCASVECNINNVVIEDCKKVSVVVDGCTEVVVKDSEHVQVQAKTGLKKCTILNSNETIIFVDSETVKTCEFFNTKCCNFTIIVVSEEDKSLAHTVPDQVSSTFDGGNIKSVPFVFSF